jgi:hypothetical protein
MAESRLEKIFVFVITSRLALELTQPIQRFSWGAYPEVKRPESEPYHTPSSSIKFNNVESIPPLSHTSSWHGAYLTEHRDNFTFTLFVLRKLKERLSYLALCLRVPQLR